MSSPARKTAMISSTAVDLPDHRQQAMDACLRQSVFPIGMEHLPAQDATGIKASIEMVDRADIYIGIYAHRYGWIPDEDTVARAEKELNTTLARGISITEMEFNRALERGIPILIFIISDEFPVPRKMVETGDLAQSKLAAFKKRAEKNRIREKFTSPEDLRGKIIHALGALEKETSSTEKLVPQFHPLNIIPKPPEPYIAHPYSLLQTKNVIGRQAELNLLTDWVTKNQTISADTRIFNIVAIGGMGKSALTWKWFNDIAPNELPHLAGRIWWSFYESDAYFENFIIRALAYTSAQREEEIRKLNPLDRENQLFHLLDTQPFLLVLDGFERILIAYARLDAAQMLDDDLDEKTKNFLPTIVPVPPPGSARVSRAVVGVPPTASTHTTTPTFPPPPTHPSSQPSNPSSLPESAADSFIGKHHLRRTADHRAGQFLRRLTRIKQSRILITTRLYPTELQADTGDPLPGCHAQFLRGLTDNDALNLWRAFNVTGSTDQLLPLYRSFGNYPLLIRALAGEIANYRPAPRDFDKWRRANPDFNPVHLPLVNAKTHILKFALLGLDEPQRKVLQTIAAFRMPASWDTLRALLVEAPFDPTSAINSRPPKPCPTNAFLDLLCRELEDRGLLGWDQKTNRYDLHPIVRSVVWRALNHPDRQDILEDLHNYFSALPPLNADKVRSLEELTAPIELYCALVGLERTEEALDLLTDKILFPMHVTIGANSTLLQLVNLVSDGLSQLDPLNKARTFFCIALAASMVGEPARAVTAFKSLLEIQDIDFNPVEAAAFMGVSMRAFVYSGRLREAEAILLEAYLLDPSKKDFNAISSVALALVFAVRGFPREAELMIKRGERLTDAKEVRFLNWEAAAQSALWNNNVKKAKVLLEPTKAMRVPDGLEVWNARIARLHGQTSLGFDLSDSAGERLTVALTEARKLNLVEEELPTLTSLAELHRRKNEHATARELLDQIWDPAERGPYPLFHADALNVLAQIERDQNNIPAAIAAATKAYTLAWCDGISADGKQCYAYHYGLTNARKHLEELRAPIPQLPPFDQSKFEPLPEVELNPKDQFWVDPATLDSLD